MSKPIKKLNTVLLDNTRVYKRKPIKGFKLSPERLRAMSRQALIYDADKVKYYQNLLNFYNNNAFGYGIQGTLTRFNPATSEGLSAIKSNFNYSRENAFDFLVNLAGAAGTGMIDKGVSLLYNKLVRGVFKTPTKKGALGTLKQYLKNPIGDGAEAVVINNTPTTVGKMTSIPAKEMAARNKVPNTVKSKYVGYVKENKTKLPTYVQNKVKVLTEETFSKYVDKLDNLMEKKGFIRVNDPNILYRGYTNGSIVVDDIAPGNVGLTTGYPILDKILPDFLKRPLIIDMAYLTVPEWIEQGFHLKNGGKL